MQFFLSASVQLVCIMLFLYGHQIAVKYVAGMENSTIFTSTTLSSISVFDKDSDITTLNNITTEAINTSSTEVFDTFTSETSNSTTDSPIVTTTIASTTIKPEIFFDSPINVTAIIPDLTQVKLNINIIRVEDCCPVNITINCTESDYNELALDYSETLTNFTTYLIIGNLSEFTNYTCTIANQYSDNSTNISFRTFKGVPGTPSNLSVIFLTTTTFKITWDKPNNVTAIIDGYNVTIERLGVQSDNHFISNCSILPEAIHTNYTNDLEYSFVGLADFSYGIIISAWSLTTKNGSTAVMNVSTDVEASEEPYNVAYEIIEQNGTKNIYRSLYISWQMPCNTNGPVNEFIIELMGEYNETVSSDLIYHKNVNSNIYIYNHTVEELQATSKYTLKIYVQFNDSIHGNAFVSYFETKDNYPSAPTITSTTTIFDRNFTLSWNEPDNKPGNITGYGIHVYYKQINWAKSHACQIETNLNKTFFLNLLRSFTAEDLIPDSVYGIEVFAETSIGIGNSTEIFVTTLSSKPEFQNISYAIENHNTLEQDKYDVNGNITFEVGCLNGNFDSYEISYIGNRSGEEDHFGEEKINDSNTRSYKFALHPARYYFVELTIKNVDFATTKSVNFSSPVGIPKFNENTISNLKFVTNTTMAVVTLDKEYFNNSNGNLSYLAIIVSSDNVTGGTAENWTDNSIWPTPENLAEIYYQATPSFWNPFKDNVTSVDYAIGDNQITCSDNDQICNKALEPAKTYFIYLRMFNAQYYRNSMPFSLETDSTKKVGLIVGIIFGLLGISGMGFVAFILWRKGVINISNIKRKPRKCNRNQTFYNRGSDSITKFLTNEEIKEPETKLSIGKFVAYCKNLEQNPEVLNAEWTNLEVKSTEIYEGLETHFALLPENKRKNRYTNILPFDHNRVKLNIDEDDEICSDYINASYLKGFSNKNEYIATQGPLSHTVRDFWKMIFQENVTMIIMVAKFIENKREKCYKYFPNNHESMLFGDDIEVKCCSELHFQIYCVRMLQVRKDLKQMTITHLQFLEWPDHGVPTGTDNLMLFIHQLRNRWAVEGGISVVHCSAGVGRTGTIIATDILIRAIQAGKKLDVFNTVLDLRRQRKLMVQTEKQYLYIHQLISNIIEDPIADDEEDNQEHVYENFKLANDKFVQTDVVESAF